MRDKKIVWEIKTMKHNKQSRKKKKNKNPLKQLKEQRTQMKSPMTSQNRFSKMVAIKERLY